MCLKGLWKACLKLLAFLLDLHNATKNSSLQMAALEQEKADENVMKLAKINRCGTYLLAMLITKSVLVNTRMTWY